jgi:DNA-binding SARP family transcriptional activator
MPNALRIGLLGPLHLQDTTGRVVPVGGRQLRVLLTLLALNAGRVVPAASMAEQIWPDDPPGKPGNALQTLVSRLRAELRQAGLDQVIESHPSGYRLVAGPEAIDAMVFETLAVQGRRALEAGDAEAAARVLRDALLLWRGEPLADAAGCDFADVASARLSELRSSVLADRIEADLALGEGAGLVGELRVLAETDPELRTARQRRWLRELIAEQDNLHAALHWAIAARDADTALRFVRALGWYWMLRGQPGEPDVLAREVLVLEPAEHSPRIAEARAVCALTAVGSVWEMDQVQPVLVSALADLAELSPNVPTTHPIAAMGEPVLALYDRDPGRAFAVFDRYATSPDPWLRAMVPLMRGMLGSLLGQLEQTESLCQEFLAAFRALGELWGTAVVLVQLAEFAEIRADYLTGIAAIDEAASLARELGAWGDLAHISGRIASIRLRMGDLERARADLERAEHDESDRGGSHDSAVWLGLVRAEMLWREGDSAAAVAQCSKALAWLDGRQSSWWYGFRALIQARLAMIVLAEGDENRCREVLADALRVATEWVESPAIAAVIDAIAVLAQHRPPPALPAPPAPPIPPQAPLPPLEASLAGATLAATLLGCGHAIRGCFNEGSLDAPVARAAARAVLGEVGFDAAYDRGRALARADALTLAANTVAAVGSSRADGRAAS